MKKKVLKKYKYILLQVDDRIATITLNRPDKLNAINDAMMSEIEFALDELRRHPDVLVIVFKGAGKCFSVGQDLSGIGTEEVMPPNPRNKPYISDVLGKALHESLKWQGILNSHQWIIAQVHGYCLGMACDLTMACRFVIATEDAVFGDPSIRMGLASPNPLWSLKIGLKKTKELLLTGRYIDGREARRIGLVNIAVPADKLEAETHIAAESFSRQGGIGGFDGLTAFWTGNWASLDFAGLPSAYRYLTSLYTLSALQRPGRSFIDRGGFDFYKIRDEQGLKAAIEARDAPFREYFPLKTSPKGKEA